jgi:hypothetical protein
MTTLDPRQLWRLIARTSNPDACKTMHLLHAQIKTEILENKISKIGVQPFIWYLFRCRILFTKNFFDNY